MYNNTIISPKEFALKAHSGMKYGSVPYSDHLYDVVYLIDIYNINGSSTYISSVLQAAGWLHDVLEDTDATYEELQNLFGSNIANLVEAVSDEKGKNRKERKAKTLPKTRKYGTHAIFIKLCDRLANIENASNTKNNDLFEMYKKEHEEFKKYLYVPGELDTLWGEIEKLL